MTRQLLLRVVGVRSVRYASSASAPVASVPEASSEAGASVSTVTASGSAAVSAAAFEMPFFSLFFGGVDRQNTNKKARAPKGKLISAFLMRGQFITCTHPYAVCRVYSVPDASGLHFAIRASVMLCINIPSVWTTCNDR